MDWLWKDDRRTSLTHYEYFEALFIDFCKNSDPQLTQVHILREQIEIYHLHVWVLSSEISSLLPIILHLLAHLSSFDIFYYAIEDSLIDEKLMDLPLDKFKGNDEKIRISYSGSFIFLSDSGLFCSKVSNFFPCRFGSFIYSTFPRLYQYWWLWGLFKALQRSLLLSLQFCWGSELGKGFIFGIFCVLIAQFGSRFLEWFPI